MCGAGFFIDINGCSIFIWFLRFVSEFHSLNLCMLYVFIPRLANMQVELKKSFRRILSTVLHVTWHSHRCVIISDHVQAPTGQIVLHLKIWQETGRRWGQVSPQCLEDPYHEGNCWCSGSRFPWKWIRVIQFHLIIKPGGAMCCIQFRLKSWLIEPVMCSRKRTRESWTISMPDGGRRPWNISDLMVGIKSLVPIVVA